MKHLLLYLITLLVICFSVNAEMVHRESKNEFKGTTSHYIKSKMVAPNKPLSFPYENTKALSMLVANQMIFTGHMWFSIK